MTICVDRAIVWIARPSGSSTWRWKRSVGAAACGTGSTASTEKRGSSATWPTAGSTLAPAAPGRPRARRPRDGPPPARAVEDRVDPLADGVAAGDPAPALLDHAHEP